ncbi:MAG TPA: hypothetical protein VGE34_03785 [Candidatus Saccharimonadales bacterium]
MSISQSLSAVRRRTGYIVAALTLVLTVALPGLVSAAQVTDRSIAMSSSSKGASSAYTVNFTAVQAAEAFVVEFCKNTPLIGEACAAANVNTNAAASASSGVTGVTHAATDRFTVAKSIAADDQVSVEVTGLVNPSTAGTIYARIVTYDSTVNAANYTSEDLGTGVQDSGSVALVVTDTVGVTGAVLESMTFCVSGESSVTPGTSPITDNCGGTLTAPTVKLGKDNSGVIALDPDDVYTGTIYTQLSTNAAKGAVINLKSDATNCGGLLRSSDPAACNIAAAGAAGNVTAGNALFGVKLGTNVTDATDGDLIAAGSYNATDYRMNFVSGNATGVTSTYGDPVFTTNNKPASNRNQTLTFGASVTNNTPAGNYAADINLTATGKF